MIRRTVLLDGCVKKLNGTESNHVRRNYRRNTIIEWIKRIYLYSYWVFHKVVLCYIFNHCEALGIAKMVQTLK